jgi:hypothetical protein
MVGGAGRLRITPPLPIRRPQPYHPAPAPPPLPPKIMAFHVTKGVRPNGTLTDGDALKPLLDGAALRVAREEGEELLGLAHPLMDLEFDEVDDDHADEVVALDLTFNGTFAGAAGGGGGGGYVVHAIEAVMLPSSAADTIRHAYKDIQVGGRGGGEGGTQGWRRASAAPAS